MQQILKDLVELQSLDIKLAEIQSLRGDLPHQVKELERELAVAEKKVSDSEKSLQDFQVEKSNTEREIKELEQKKDKYQKQLFSVKSNREYDAVTMEIEQVNTFISDKESRVLEIIEKLEELTKTIEDEKQVFEKLKSQYKSKKDALDKKIKETEKDEAYLNDQIDKIQRKIPPRHLALYKRIKNAKGGLAVVPVIRKSCGGCYKNLPPQKVLEIRKMNQIHLCEVCGRILVWDEHINEEVK